MHAYVVEDFKRVPILVNIKQITKGQTHPWQYHCEHHTPKFGDPCNFKTT
jgi:hypothetical protein